LAVETATTSHALISMYSNPQQLAITVTVCSV